MRANLYPRLAWDGIRKNKRFYAPYLLTCIGMVMMCYILRYLASMPSLNDMPGGSTMTMILELGFSGRHALCRDFSVLHEFVSDAKTAEGIWLI